MLSLGSLASCNESTSQRRVIANHLVQVHYVPIGCELRGFTVQIGTLTERTSEAQSQSAYASDGKGANSSKTPLRAHMQGLTTHRRKALGARRSARFIRDISGSQPKFGWRTVHVEQQVFQPGRHRRFAQQVQEPPTPAHVGR